MTSNPFFGHEEDRARQYLEDGRRRLEELAATIRKERTMRQLEKSPPRDFTLLKRFMRGAELRPWEQRRAEYLARKLD